MSKLNARKYGFCNGLALFGALALGCLAAPLGAQVVDTVSPAGFNTPLYQNPFDFPGAIPLIQPLGYIPPTPVDTLSFMGVTGLGARVNSPSDVPPGIMALEAPADVPLRISNEQSTAPRLEQLTAPSLPSSLPPAVRLQYDMRTGLPKDPRIAHLTESVGGSPGVGAQQLSDIHAGPTTLGIRRIDAVPPNPIEMSREQIAARGRSTFVGSRTTFVIPQANIGDVSDTRTAALEAAAYTRRDPLSPEEMASGRSFRTNSSVDSMNRVSSMATSSSDLLLSGATGANIGGRTTLPMMLTPGVRSLKSNTFAFQPYAMLAAHEQLSKKVNTPKTLAAAEAARNKGVLKRPFKSITLPQNQQILPHVPRVTLGNRTDPGTLPQ